MFSACSFLVPLGVALTSALALAQRDPTLPRGPLPGDAPGTFQYLVELKSRSFDPREVFRTARRQVDPAQRRAMIESLRGAAELDQGSLRVLVESKRGKWKGSYWASNVMHCDIPETEVNSIRALASVRRVWEVAAYGPSGFESSTGLPPTWDSVQPYHHNAIEAKNQVFVPIWNNDTTRIAGKDITVAFFDTGIDLDAALSPPQPHPAFRDASGGFTRIRGSFLVQGSMITPPNSPCGAVQVNAIDCNQPGVHPFIYIVAPTNPLTHRDARHGTGMATVAVGRDTGQMNADGHAPDASIVTWNISRGNPANSFCGGIRWLIDDPAYLTALQMLVQWVAEQSDDEPLQILNISWAGWPDPNHPVEAALDDWSNALDVLVVTSAGNEGDATVLSHGMHNGISVGAAVKGSPGVGVANFSSRGPMQFDYDRYFPDMCAIGQNVTTYHVDPGNTQGQVPPTYVTSGTSIAAPQVSGAAALYMARRLNYAGQLGSPATALETKAALLLNIKEGLTTQSHTYQGRNAMGLGYLRDDYLCEYAERHGTNPTIQARLGPVIPWAQEVQVLTQAAATKSIFRDISSVTKPASFAVVIAWNAQQPDPGQGNVLADVDLELWSQGTCLARAATRRNSYERLVWHYADPAIVTQLEIRLVGTDLKGLAAVPVHVALRFHPETSSPGAYATTGTVESVETGCAPAGPQPSDEVGRVLPSNFTEAWGNAPALGLFHQGFIFPVPGPNVFHTVLRSNVVGGPFTATGMALRTWRPFSATKPWSQQSYQIHFVGMAQTAASAPAAPAPVPTTPTTGWTGRYQGSSAKIVVGTPYDVTIENWPPTQTARGWYEWTVPIPFAQPFTYDPNHIDGSNLAIWVELQPGNGLEIDYVTGLVQDVNTWWASHQAPLVGGGPLMGLVLAATAQPSLACYGFPEIGRSVVLHARNFGSSPAGLPVLMVGPKVPAIQLPPSNCLLHVDPQAALYYAPTWIPHSGSAASVVAIPYSPQLLFSEIFAQVVQANGTLFPQTSNTLRLRIGGN